VAGPRRRLTRRLRERLGREGVAQPVLHVAARYGVSPATVRRAVAAHTASRHAARPSGTVLRLGAGRLLGAARPSLRDRAA